MTVDRIGIGAGAGPARATQRSACPRRAFSRATHTQGLVLVETTIDDLDPRAYPDVLAARNRQAR